MRQTGGGEGTAGRRPRSGLQGREDAGSGTGRGATVPRWSPDMPSKASKPETGRATGGKRVELHAPHWTPRICTQQTAEGLRTGDRQLPAPQLDKEKGERPGKKEPEWLWKAKSEVVSIYSGRAGSTEVFGGLGMGLLMQM